MVKFAASLTMSISIFACHAFAADYDLTTYDIAGSTPDELIASIKSNGPSGYAGETNLDPPDFSINFAEAGGKCKTVAGKIDSYKITVLLPSWKDQASGDACVVGSYTKMYDALKLHEERHVKIFADGKPSLATVLNGVNLPGGCSTETKDKLTSAAKALLVKKQAEIQKASDDFDKKTEHGLKDKPPVVMTACP